MHRFATTTAGLVGLIVPSAAIGQVTTFTDRQAFVDAVSDIETVTFESERAGALVESGTRIGPVTISYEIPGGVAAITQAHAQSTPTGRRSLGLIPAGATPSDDAFLSGDAVMLTFTERVQAVGLSVIGSPGDIRAGDLALHFAEYTVVNDAVPDATLSDGGDAYFLGIVLSGPSQGARSAVIESLDPTRAGLFVFNIDDIAFSGATRPLASATASAQGEAAQAVGPIVSSLEVDDIGAASSRTLEDRDDPGAAESRLSNTDESAATDDEMTVPIVGFCWPVGLVAYCGLFLGWVALRAVSPRRSGMA